MFYSVNIIIYIYKYINLLILGFNEIPKDLIKSHRISWNPLGF